jgi:hypothetical protein
MTFASTLGLAAGVIGFIAFVPYIIGTLNRTTKPNKATWIVWSAVGLTIAASYYASGARTTAWVPVSYAIGMTIVAILSLRYGVEGWTNLDKCCLAGAGAGLTLWAITKNPVLAYYLTTAVDAMGFMPTIKKAWDKPEEEANLAWPIFVVANTLNLFAITQWNFTIALYPVYDIILSGVITAFVFWPGRRKIKA